MKVPPLESQELVLQKRQDRDVLQVLDSWLSSTSLDGADSQHGGLSSTYSSLQQYAMEDFPSTSPGFIPTPAGLDVRASKGSYTGPCQKRKDNT